MQIVCEPPRSLNQVSTTSFIQLRVVLSALNIAVIGCGFPSRLVAALSFFYCRIRVYSTCSSFLACLLAMLLSAFALVVVIAQLLPVHGVPDQLLLRSDLILMSCFHRWRCLRRCYRRPR